MAFCNPFRQPLEKRFNKSISSAQSGTGYLCLPCQVLCLGGVFCFCKIGKRSKDF